MHYYINTVLQFAGHGRGVAITDLRIYSLCKDPFQKLSDPFQGLSGLERIYGCVGMGVAPKAHKWLRRRRKNLNSASPKRRQIILPLRKWLFEFWGYDFTESNLPPKETYKMEHNNFSTVKTKIHSSLRLKLNFFRYVPDILSHKLVEAILANVTDLYFIGLFN